jgi:hypothetical protein
MEEEEEEEDAVEEVEEAETEEDALVGAVVVEGVKACFESGRKEFEKQTNGNKKTKERTIRFCRKATKTNTNQFSDP